MVAGKGRPEDDSDPKRRVRAELIRWLMLGGDADHRPAVDGIWLSGAVVVGGLDLAGCCSTVPLELVLCLFPNVVSLPSTQLEAVGLNGCLLQSGLYAQSLMVRTGFMCRRSGETRPEIKGGCDFAGAEIGGQLGLNGCKLTHPGGDALMLAGAKIGEHVFLEDGFHAIGEVSMVGADIGGQLGLEDAVLENGPVRGLDLQDARIKYGLFLRGIASVTGELDLTNAQCGVLVDDDSVWDKFDSYDLEGFKYGATLKTMSVTKRLQWLDGNSENTRDTSSPARRMLGATHSDFDPQPYTHLAKIIRCRRSALGRRAGARGTG